MRTDGPLFADDADDVVFLYQGNLGGTDCLADKNQAFLLGFRRFAAFDVHEQAADARGNILNIVGTCFETVVIHAFEHLSKLFSDGFDGPLGVDAFTEDQIANLISKLGIVKHFTVNAIQIWPGLIFVDDLSLIRVHAAHLLGSCCDGKIKALDFSFGIVDVVFFDLDLLFPVDVHLSHRDSRGNAKSFHLELLLCVIWCEYNRVFIIRVYSPLNAHDLRAENEKHRPQNTQHSPEIIKRQFFL